MADDGGIIVYILIDDLLTGSGILLKFPSAAVGDVPTTISLSICALGRPLSLTRLPALALSISSPQKQRRGARWARHGPLLFLWILPRASEPDAEGTVAEEERWLDRAGQGA